MIRRAIEADIPALVEMGRKFHAMAPHGPMGAFDEAGVENVLRFLITSPSALVLTNGDGAIGGVLSPVYFNPSKTMAEESFWWARKGGKELLQEFERAARLMGADFVLLSTLENELSTVIDRVVSRVGYLPVERRYLKELA